MFNVKLCTSVNTLRERDAYLLDMHESIIVISDLAIGAPYDGVNMEGAVYIFLGGKQVHKQHSQVGYALALVIHVKNKLCDMKNTLYVINRDFKHKKVYEFTGYICQSTGGSPSNQHFCFLYCWRGRYG